MLRYLYRFAVITTTLINLTTVSPGMAEGGTLASLPTAPDPALCTNTPRSRAEFRSLVESGRSNPDLVAPPDLTAFVGKPADAATISAVTHTTVELYACYPGGELLRASNLFSDRALARLFSDPTYPVDDIAALQGPLAPEPWEDRPILLNLRDVTILSDGRVGFFLELAYLYAGSDTQYVIVTRIDGRYRLDETRDVGPMLDLPATEATPTAFADPDIAGQAALLERYCVAGNACDAATRARFFAIRACYGLGRLGGWKVTLIPASRIRVTSATRSGPSWLRISPS